MAFVLFQIPAENCYCCALFQFLYQNALIVADRLSLSFIQEKRKNDAVDLV